MEEEEGGVIEEKGEWRRRRREGSGKEEGRRKEWDGSPGGAAGEKEEHWRYNPLPSCISHIAKSDSVKRREGGREEGRRWADGGGSEKRKEE